MRALVFAFLAACSAPTCSIDPETARLADHMQRLMTEQTREAKAMLASVRQWLSYGEDTRAYSALVDRWFDYQQAHGALLRELRR